MMRLLIRTSWFRASALQAEGRRFESVNAHKTKSYRNVALFFIACILRISISAHRIICTNRGLAVKFHHVVDAFFSLRSEA